jgi:hypothetical protein
VARADAEFNSLVDEFSGKMDGTAKVKKHKFV